jgi:hypothetical protein
MIIEQWRRGGDIEIFAMAGEGNKDHRAGGGQKKKRPSTSVPGLFDGKEITSRQA